MGNSYSLEKEGIDFDWNQFLNREDITEKQWAYASQLAGEWVTCACGSQCAIIPRHPGGMPRDFSLSNLGYQFNTAVECQERLEALAILQKIEARSAYLIEQIKKTTIV